MKGHVACVALLVERGANKDAKNKVRPRAFPLPPPLLAASVRMSQAAL
jgi:hypothetical protein